MCSGSGLRNAWRVWAAKVLELWTGELDAMRDEGCLLVITMHPFLSGRPARAKMLGEFLDRVRDRADVWVARADEIADRAEATILPGASRVLELPRFD
jgi:peptidoglycan/xylan/chitin deacetylase (PgdA/CDA1 family)